MKILRTGAGSPVSEAVIQALKAEECEVICADSDPLAYGIAKHGGVVISEAKASEFARWIEKFLLECDYDVIIPGVDEELPFWANQKQDKCKIVVSPRETIRLFESKYSSFLWFMENKIKTPDTAWYQFEYSMIHKPERGRGGEGGAPYIWQKYIHGTEYTVDALCDFSGKLLCGAVRERIKTKAGTSIQARIVDRPDIWSDVVRICSLSEFHGPICLQCISNDDGNWWIDVNPRYGGGVALSIEAGVPIVKDLVRLLKGEAVTITGCVTKPLTMMRYWKEFYRS